MVEWRGNPKLDYSPKLNVEARQVRWKQAAGGRLQHNQFDPNGRPVPFCSTVTLPISALKCRLKMLS